MFQAWRMERPCIQRVLPCWVRALRVVSWHYQFKMSRFSASAPWNTLVQSTYAKWHLFISASSEATVWDSQSLDDAKGGLRQTYCCCAALSAVVVRNRILEAGDGGAQTWSVFVWKTLCTDVNWQWQIHCLQRCPKWRQCVGKGCWTQLAIHSLLRFLMQSQWILWWSIILHARHAIHVRIQAWHPRACHDFHIHTAEHLEYCTMHKSMHH